MRKREGQKAEIEVLQNELKQSKEQLTRYLLQFRASVDELRSSQSELRTSTSRLSSSQTDIRPLRLRKTMTSPTELRTSQADVRPSPNKRSSVSQIKLRFSKIEEDDGEKQKPDIESEIEKFFEEMKSLDKELEQAKSDLEASRIREGEKLEQIRVLEKQLEDKLLQQPASSSSNSNNKKEEKEKPSTPIKQTVEKWNTNTIKLEASLVAVKRERDALREELNTTGLELNNMTGIVTKQKTRINELEQLLRKSTPNNAEESRIFRRTRET